MSVKVKAIAHEKHEKHPILDGYVVDYETGYTRFYMDDSSRGLPKSIRKLIDGKTPDRVYTLDGVEYTIFETI